MLKNVQWLLIGVLVMVLGALLMTLVNRRNGKKLLRRRHSFVLSFLDLFISTLAGIIFGDASIPGLGGVFAIMFIFGFIMTLANGILLIQHIFSA